MGVRIRRFAETEVLQALEVDFIDESESDAPTKKTSGSTISAFRSFAARVILAKLCRIGEGRRMIHQGRSQLRQRGGSRSPHAHHRQPDEAPITRRRTDARSQELGAPLDLIRQVAKPANCGAEFSAGGIATPATRLSFVVSARKRFRRFGHFQISDRARAKAVVKARRILKIPKPYWKPAKNR
jgi:pyridoxal 5'-phosphate synthase pdxS subunit